MGLTAVTVLHTVPTLLVAIIVAALEAINLDLMAPAVTVCTSNVVTAYLNVS